MRSVPATKEIALLTLSEAVQFIVDNDDLEIPEGHKPIEYLRGVVSVATVAAIFGVTTDRVARLALRSLRRK